MRITQIDLYSSNLEEPITFTLDKASNKDQYEVRTILGLDAEEIIAKFYGMSLFSGSRFYDFGMKPRDIVMRVVLNPRTNLDETFSDIRDRLYRAISATRMGVVQLHFLAGATTVARIYGSISKFEAVHFTNLPEVQLTINCSDPMFRGINPVVFDSVELSTTDTVRIPDSLSTAPHGFVMNLTFTATKDSFTINDVSTDPEWQFKIVPHGNFLAGDVLHISSEASNKYAYFMRGATYHPLMDVIESGSVWPILFPGQNEFFFADYASFDWNLVEYYPAYWGV